MASVPGCEGFKADRPPGEDVYAVVGCSECSALWVLEVGGETAGCPRCGRRHRTDRLKHFVETDDEAHAREVRASMLASRQGEGDAFAALEDYRTLGERAADGVVDDAEYLEGAGLDADAVAAAGEQATERGGGSRSPREVVEAALRELEAPDRDAVVDYAADRDVDAETARDRLDRLVRSGAATERDGGYRLL